MADPEPRPDALRSGVAPRLKRSVIDPFRLARLRYHLGEPSAVPAAYPLWRGVWRDTFRELDDLEDLRSDDFTRQDRIGVLFDGDEAVGMTAFRWVDLDAPSTRDDSYFRPWPEAAVRALRRDGPRLCIGSNLTVRPGWRGPVAGQSVSRMLLEHAVREFLRSSADVMAGTMRNDRGVQRTAYALGAVPLAEGVAFHGVSVDLVAWYRADCLEKEGRIP
jgi:hypothetical protein